MQNEKNTHPKMKRLNRAGKRRISIKLPAAMVEEFRQLARKENSSMAYVLSEAFRSAVQQEQRRVGKNGSERP